ncbi:CHAT domain-containing protein [Streptomyces sp. NPDC012756]|uniref:CHAT domain-containing protein n=1 Tax=Streptomyces sp. NPDC012756 TaxID=3364847 RepID=UPI00368DEA48
MSMRDALLESIRARLNEVVATGDRSPVMEQAAIGDAMKLMQYGVNETAVDAEVLVALGWFYFWRSQELPEPRAEAERGVALQLLAIPFLGGEQLLPEPLLLPLAESAIPEATNMLLRTLRTPVGVRDAALPVAVWSRITLHLPEDHVAYYSGLSSLGLAWRRRWEIAGDPVDLNCAVEVAREIAETLPAGRPGRATYWFHLSTALHLRFEQGEDAEDLDGAVEAGREAVRTATDDDPDRCLYLTGLSKVLLTRYARTGDRLDLGAALQAAGEAIAQAPERHPDHTMLLTNHANALLARYATYLEADDIVEAARMNRFVVRIAPRTHFEYARYLSNACGVLRLLFAHTKNAEDVNEAIEYGYRAVRATPAGDPERTMYQIGLVEALRDRFDALGDFGDLDEAVAVCRAAARGAAQLDHPDQAMVMSVLGSVLQQRYERDGTSEDRDEALGVWERTVAMRTAPPLLRVGTARLAAELAAPSEPGRAARFLEQAILLLPEVAPRRLRRGDQQRALGAHGDQLTADAIALALSDTGVSAPERASRALRLAEAGRAILLAQSLDIRGDVTELRDQHPDLAREFVDLRGRLDEDADTVGASAAVPGAPSHSAHLRLAKEMEALLGRIRAHDGFTRFGLPPTFDELAAQAGRGPVVTLNVSRHRSDALILTPDGVTACPLPGLAFEEVARQIGQFHLALVAATAPDADRIAAQRMLHEVLEWLWEAAAEPILTALDALVQLPDGQDALPHVWWAPGGMLGLLPLHAAGFHRDPGRVQGRRTVLDRVVSSYTPTIRALRHARAHRPAATDRPRPLIVSMSTTPGHAPLPHAAQETDRLRALLKDPVVLSASGERPATKATVLAQLEHCTIAHFACHGITESTDPSQSKLLLQDHDETPLTVSALSRADLAHAQLAYLSACRTAHPGSPRLLGEAIHLTSACQLAGFSHVIGTMWTIDDRLAADIAESFYTHLADGLTGAPDPARAATALHRTVKDTRDRFPATPSLWAGYLHSGA